MRLPRPEVWDSKWRIIMFDIPEVLKKNRDAFATVMKRLGFEKLQKSVFICPFPCEGELKTLAKYFGIDACVVIILTEHIPNEQYLIKRFALRK